MILENLAMLQTPEDSRITLEIKGAIIKKIFKQDGSTPLKAIHFNHALVIPGLINSHDHLCFNLFPKLGGGIYQNYKEWALDVQSNYQNEIQKLAKIPKPLLYQWGILKNVINGFTTVVQHGPFFSTSFNGLIDVFTQTYPLHSVSFERRWKIKVLRPIRKPIVMHLGEGVSQDVTQELRRVNRWNWFGNTIIPVHGIQMTPDLVPHFKALIWCPESNYELYRTTVNLTSIQSKLPILFGSDSTISASWDIWQHLRRLFKLNLMNQEQLISTLTTNPSQVWNLSKTGAIKEGFLADLTIVDRLFEDPWDTFKETSPASILMVIKAGKIVLCDEKIWPQLSKDLKNERKFFKLKVQNTYKWIAADVDQLLKKIKGLAPSVVFPFGT